MGGKLLMHMALTETAWIDKCVVVDIAPVSYSNAKTTSLSTNYIDTMIELRDQNVRSMKEADLFLSKTIHQLEIRQFLLTNLKKSNDGIYRFRINLDSLKNNMSLLSGFDSFDSTYNGDTMFIKGDLSDYINDQNTPTVYKLFPNASMEIVKDAGHWIHAEKPSEFISLVSKFLQA
jgi:pimeloyl-ACP methyl ester carboxylesterase